MWQLFWALLLLYAATPHVQEQLHVPEKYRTKDAVPYYDAIAKLKQMSLAQTPYRKLLVIRCVLLPQRLLTHHVQPLSASINACHLYDIYMNMHNMQHIMHHLYICHRDAAKIVMSTMGLLSTSGDDLVVIGGDDFVPIWIYVSLKAAIKDMPTQVPFGHTCCCVVLSSALFTFVPDPEFG